MFWVYVFLLFGRYWLHITMARTSPITTSKDWVTLWVRALIWTCSLQSSGLKSHSGSSWNWKYIFFRKNMSFLGLDSLRNTKFPGRIQILHVLIMLDSSLFLYRRDGNVVVLTGDEACSPRAPTEFSDTCDVDVIMPTGMSCSFINSNRIKLSEGKLCTHTILQKLCFDNPCVRGLT